VNVFELAQAVAAVENKQATNQSILIYGPPKIGKTRLAATLAKVPEVTSVTYFGAENGHATIVDMVRTGVLTEEEAKKIIIINMVDTPEQAVAWDTVVKCLVVQKAFNICEVHGRVECPHCKAQEVATKTKLSWQAFDLKKLRSTDWVILDSGSQIADSAMNYIQKGVSYDIKAGYEEYGFQGRVMTDILTVVQSAQYCNYCVITHELLMDARDDDKKMLSEVKLKDMFSKLYPLVGSKPFSMKVGKYFGHVIYMERKINKPSGGSAFMYKPDVVTGSRSGMRLEDETEMDFRYVFEKMGWTAWKRPATK